MKASASMSIAVPAVGEVATRCASKFWVSSEPELAAANTVTRMPNPKESPSWWATFTSPEAALTSLEATPAIPETVRGSGALKSGSTRTVPVQYSVGPLLDAASRFA
jgi:hypothetical protein